MENGTDCCESTWVKGCNQLNSNNSFLREWCLVSHSDDYWALKACLVSDNPAAVEVSRETMSCSHGGRVGLRRSLLLVNEKWNHSPSRIEY